MPILRFITKFTMFLLNNIICIALYGSALLIAINNCTIAVVIFYIASHLTLILLFTNEIVEDGIVSIKKTSLPHFIFELSIIEGILIILIVREHWYLTGITLLFTMISVGLHLVQPRGIRTKTGTNFKFKKRY